MGRWKWHYYGGLQQMTIDKDKRVERVDRWECMLCYEVHQFRREAEQCVRSHKWQ